MERAPKNEEILDSEQTAYGVWEHKRDAAPEEVESLIASIKGFEEMSTKEQLRVLQARLVELSDKQKDPDFNRNRALVEEIARRMDVIEATSAFQAAMDRLEQSRPTGGRILTEA